MANVNLGTTRATNFNRHARIRIDDGTDVHTLSKYVEGSWNLRLGLNTTYAEMNNGAFDGDVHELNEQASEFGFAVKNSADNYAAAMAVLRAASTGGLITKFTVYVDMYDDATLTNGQRMTFTECYVPEGGVQTGDPGDGRVDELAFTVRSLDTQPALSDISS